MINHLSFMMGRDGFSGLFQINGCGPWRNEYKTDSLLANGEYDVLCDGKKVGTWIQGTLGHQLKVVSQ